MRTDRAPLVRLVMCLALLALPAPFARAQDAGGPRPPLEEARQMYDEARFADAIQLLTTALQSGGVTGDDVNLARALRARCLVKAGRRVEAKEGFKSVLRSDAGYRPDPVKVPPDEIEVFQLALKEFQAEQLEAGRRVPASIGFLYGVGQAVNQDLVDLASSAGVAEADDFKSNGEFGYSVRFPLKPRLSVDFEVMRFRATTSDQLDPGINDHANYTANGTPITANLVWNAWGRARWRLSGVAGVGFMHAEGIVQFLHLHGARLIPVQIVGTGHGPFLRAAVEGEYLPAPRFAIAGRVGARYANSGNLTWKDNTFEVYEGYPESRLGDRSVDFSGLEAHVMLRAYIGY